jgi:hypothetical protein
MDFARLRDAVRRIGLNDLLLISLIHDVRGASPEVGYNVLQQEDGIRILAGNERGQLVEAPYAGCVFADESSACAYVWRRIRTVAAPESLTDEERELNRLEALEILRAGRGRTRDEDPGQ